MNVRKNELLMNILINELRDICINELLNKYNIHTLRGPQSRSWQWSHLAGAAVVLGAQRWAGASGGGAAASRPRTSTSSVLRLCQTKVARRTTLLHIEAFRCVNGGQLMIIVRPVLLSMSIFGCFMYVYIQYLKCLYNVIDTHHIITLFFFQTSPIKFVFRGFANSNCVLFKYSVVISIIL